MEGMENKNEQIPDYLNPKSNKYYKGFRYEKNEFGGDVWYDGNEVIRKGIAYWSDENKRGEYFYNEKGERHNEEDYAIREWEENGLIIRKWEYYLNGIELTEEQWKEEVTKLTLKQLSEQREWIIKKWESAGLLEGLSFSKQPEWMNPKSNKYYKGFRYEKLGCIEFWYDENNIRRKNIAYYTNGVKWVESYYNEKGEYHNVDKPAYIYYDEHGDIYLQNYYLNGEQLTDEQWDKYMDGLYDLSFSKQPEEDYEVEKTFDDNNNLKSRLVYFNSKKWYQEFFNPDMKYHNEDGAAYSEWDENGYIIEESYYINGEELTFSEWFVEKAIAKYHNTNEEMKREENIITGERKLSFGDYQFKSPKVSVKGNEDFYKKYLISIDVGSGEDKTVTAVYDFNNKIFTTSGTSRSWFDKQTGELKSDNNEPLHKQEKPPLGLRPKFIHDEERLNEVKEAIKRYYNADKELPIEWIEEHNELIKTINKYKLTKK